jgi:hypothetical protein
MPRRINNACSNRQRYDIVHRGVKLQKKNKYLKETSLWGKKKYAQS